MNNTAVEIQKLTRKFGKFTAVDRIDLSVNKGEIFGFLGPNGAGKSTTIKMLTGLLKPTSGKGTIGGFDLNRESEKIKQNIGYMAQKFSLYAELTPEENLIFFGGIYKVPRKRILQKAEHLFDTTSIGKHRKSLTGLLPLGLKQRLALTCAMLHEPPLLFLDEPTSGVDPLARREFWDIIYATSQKGTTVFITTHYMDEAEHADRIAMIFSGKLKAVETPHNLKQNFSGGKIIKLECQNPSRALSHLESNNNIMQIAAYGNKLNLTLANNYRIDDLRGFISENEIEYISIEETSPTLEDVFINLTAQETD